ncbi:polysaccharide lyase family 7 protein [Aquimarina sp. SS2-1]|uniref:polysaccharide lyase family 7 protein n=1 Tax=Aquimarina besae TaxID=3342247 RepID=UPI00366CE8B7
MLFFLVLSTILMISCVNDDQHIIAEDTETHTESISKALDSPYDKLELSDSDWKIQLPIEKNAKSCSGKTYNYGVLNVSNSSLQSGYSHSTYFDVYDQYSAEFVTPGKGPTTSCGTTGPRTELRQNTEWNTNGNNTRTLKIKLRITQFSDSRQLGFAQIHTGSDDLMLLYAQRVSSSSNQFYLKMRGDAVKRGADRLNSDGFLTNSSGSRLKFNMNTAYEFKIQSGNNRIKVQTKNSSGNFYTLYNDPTLEDSSTAHFKAGIYILNNTSGSGQKDGTAKVRFYTVDYDN